MPNFEVQVKKHKPEMVLLHTHTFSDIFYKENTNRYEKTLNHLTGSRCAQWLTTQQHVLWLGRLGEADLTVTLADEQHGFPTTSCKVRLRAGKLHPVITVEGGAWSLEYSHT